MCKDTRYLHENEDENLQNGDVHLAQIPDFEMGCYQKNRSANVEKILDPALFQL